MILAAQCEPTSYIVTINSFLLKFVLAWIKHCQTKSLSSVAQPPAPPAPSIPRMPARVHVFISWYPAGSSASPGSGKRCEEEILNESWMCGLCDHRRQRWLGNLSPPEMLTQREDLLFLPFGSKPCSTSSSIPLCSIVFRSKWNPP